MHFLQLQKGNDVTACWYSDWRTWLSGNFISVEFKGQT